MGTIKLKTKFKKGVVNIKALINHPMETGLRKDKKTGEKVPAHFIQEVTVEANGKMVLEAAWNSSVSKKPYLSFAYKGKSGDKVKLSWKDNKGETDETESTVK
ncbi:MAG: thiosulfate oxidation carrier complex protein SoxZ [Thiotrichaceae bacterium]|nr:thiosulfate oxidation carrier complex protein SoxZ [Thiotrichaceae bacterium]